MDRYEADDGGQRRNCHLGEFQSKIPVDDEIWFSLLISLCML